MAKSAGSAYSTHQSERAQSRASPRRERHDEKANTQIQTLCRLPQPGQMSHRRQVRQDEEVMAKVPKKSRVNEAGNYTKPGLRKRLFEQIKAADKGGKSGQWSARKAQMLAKRYKASGGGYRD